MKLWKTITAGFLVLALGAYIWLVEKPRMEAEGREEHVVEVSADEVTRIRLEYPDSPTIVVERSGDGWRMLEPVEAPADGPAVDRLLKQIVNAKVERRIPPDKAQELKIYGLEGHGERARITLTKKDGSTLPDIIVGKTTPVGFQAFARVEGERDVLVTPLIFHTGVKKTPFDLRDKRLFRIEPKDVKALVIEREGTKIRAEREGDGWRIVAPRNLPGDRDRLEAMVTGINGIRAVADYGPDDVDRKKFGLEEPKLVVTAELGDKGTVGFRIGAKDEGPPAGYYFERAGDGQVAKVAEWVEPRFDQDLNDLRDKHLFRCEADEIVSITFERADGQSFSLRKDEQGNWTISPPSDRRVKEAAVTRTRNGLASLAGKEIVAEDANTPAALAPYGLDKPAVRVEVRMADDKSCGQVIGAVVGADTDNPRYYVKREDEGTVMSVPEYLYSRLDMVAEDFLEPASSQQQPAGEEEKKPARKTRKQKKSKSKKD